MLVKRPALLLNVGLAMASLAVAGWAYQTITSSGSQNTASTNRRVATVSTGDVTATVSASGSVTSAQVSEANFVTSGTVTEIDVDVGDSVTKGQVLAKVDPSAAQDSLDTAEANLTAAKAALSRAKSSSTSDSATITSAQATVTSAEETLSSAQRAVDGTVLKAAMAGTVTAVNGAVGNSSSASAASTDSTTTTSSSGFIEIADLSKLQVSADFAEADATKLKGGQKATVTWSALAGATATGAVVSIAPTATTSNDVNSYAVTVSVDKAPDGVRIGQTVSAAVTVDSAANVPRVPTAAVRSAGGQYTVQVVSGTQTQTVLVEVGVQGDTFDEITSGLSMGQQVVLQQTTSNNSGGNGVPGGLPNFPGGGGIGGPPAGGGR
jgi:macrolide-specific efflux system membrane fusion protein